MGLFKKKETEKGTYPRSFAKRLTWRIMLTMFLVMGVISLIIYGIAWAVTYSQTFLLSNRILANKCMKVEQTLSEVYVASVNTVPDIENTLNRPDRMARIMKRIVELNPNIRSCGISFVDNYYPEKGHWFCPYAMRRPNDSIIVMKTIGGTNENYLNAEWFTEALKSDKGFWSKPFLDSSDQKTPLVAYLLPIRDERDSTVAILGVDVSLDQLAKDNLIDITPASDSTQQWDPSYEIYYFITDPDGTFLMHPDSKRIGRENYFTYADATPDTLDNYLGHEMMQHEMGHFQGSHTNELSIEGQEVMVSYQRLNYTPWTLALVIPRFYINLVGYCLGGLLLFFILIGLIVVFFTGRRHIRKVAKPLKQLAASADEVAKGNFDAPLPEMKQRDEIHQLRDSFENMQQSLTRYVQQLREATAQKAAIESELKVAHDIQMSMLPKTFPPYPERTDLDIFGSLTPAKGVGGDLFDFYIRDERLFFCIGDVSGKGVPASLFMAVTRSLFRNVSAHESEPHLIVKALNVAQSEGNDTSMFVTLFVGVLDLATGRLDYCNAGHDAPLLIGNDDVTILPCESNVVIGIIPDFEFSKQQVMLQPQTTIFLFTDGLNEAENSRHDQFGDQRIMGIAQSLDVTGDHRPTTVVGKMSEAVHSFVGDAEQSDDLTMLAIQYIK
ncbi:MAG: SpoIIE family protein phosphatase [Prevotella sp.]|nr:SpoIIE family protein phosphatase [Prevotella sp.]